MKLFLALSVFVATVYSETFTQCDEMTTGTSVASAKGCKYYIICDGDNSIEAMCPESLMFNSKDGLCQEADSFECTVDEKQSTLETTSTTTPKPNNIVGINPRDLCTGSFSGYFAYASNCHYYYRCTKGLLTIQECPTGLGWDTTKYMCTSTGCSI